MQDYAQKAAGYVREFENRSSGFNLPKLEFIDKWTNSRSTQEPVVTASMPVCNQASLITNILLDFIENVTVPTKLIMIFDGCTDPSESVVRKFIATTEGLSPDVTEIVLFKTNADFFESSCDNFSLSLSDTSYFLTIQADNFLCDKTLLPRAISAMESFSDLAGVSTRGVVPFDHPRRKPHKVSRIRQIMNLPSRILPRIFNLTFLGPFIQGLSFFGDVSTPPVTKLKFSKRASRIVYVGEAVVRGPILWKTDYLKQIGGFNDVAYFLGWDDYDICYRLYTKNNLRVGYMPSSAYSLSNTGTNSFPRSAKTQAEYKRREELASRNPGEISRYWDQRDMGLINLSHRWERRTF